jgi:pimeloyl-ACP methyl ester carboxylesterase
MTKQTDLTRRFSLGLIGGGALSLVTARRPAHAADAPMTLATATGNIQGTLVVPDGPGPFSVVVIIAGSGPTDRDGNSRLGVKTDAYKLLAAALAAGGIASLRYDKRLIGASIVPDGNQSNLRFEMYAADAAGWVQMLARDSRFRHVFIAGHSEGSLLGILAAETAPVSGYVSLCGSGRPAYALIHDQLAAGISADQLAQADAIMAKLRTGQLVPDVPQGPVFAQLFSASIQPYLISWFKYDPAVEIAKLRCPVLIVGGTADVQVPPHDAEILKAAAPRARLLIIDGMSHVLKHVAGTAQAQQIPAYTDPSLPLEPAVVTAIVALVRGAA